MQFRAASRHLSQKAIITLELRFFRASQNEVVTGYHLFLKYYDGFIVKLSKFEITDHLHFRVLLIDFDGFKYSETTSALCDWWKDRDKHETVLFSFKSPYGLVELSLNNRKVVLSL